MNKFGRNYELIVEATGGGPDVIIKPPFTVQFDVTRHRYSSATMSVIRIYNLSENNRAKLRKDQLQYELRKKLVFRAGYGNNLSTLCVGNVMRGFSVRQETEYITTLEIFDGGLAFATATSSIQYGENTPYRTVVVDLIKSLKPYDIGAGSIGNIQGTALRGLSVTGPTISNLRELSQGNFFIDNGLAHCLSENECVPAPLKVIDASAGLLDTPEREMQLVNLKMLFEPKILAGQKLEVKSTTEKSINGVYQVIAITHSGIISEAVNGDCSTTLSLKYGAGSLFDVGGF